jgi:RNA polymerase sigma factor (sigma-70 family)
MPLLRQPPGALRRSRLASSPARAGSDRRLANRASKGDRQAFAAIFERYRQELYGFCLGLLGEPQDAQDALQNTMVKVLRSLPGEEREIALRPWLYRIAHNEAIELRRSRRPTQVLEGHLVDGQSSVTERAEQREQLEWLLKDLVDLPERQRTVLVMRELSGLDFAEIGAALDTSGAVVRQSLYEARRNLEQMEHGRDLACDAVTRVLSDADGRIARRRDVRAHLRDCPDCRRFRSAIERREGALASLQPVAPPAGGAAAGGLAQALAGGSGGGGTVAGLAGGVAKSAGVYGALKAAGTLAAVAVIGTAAVQGGTKGSPPASAERDAVAQSRDGSPTPPPSTHRPRAVQLTHVAGTPVRLAPAKPMPAAVSVSAVADRQRRPRPPAGHGSDLQAIARPAELREGTGTALVTAPPAAGTTAEAGQGRKDSDRGQSVKPEPKERDQPAEPNERERPEQAKTPPGQAKKQAAEEPPPESRPLVEAGSEAETPQHGSEAEPNGEAKGHEKQLEASPEGD